MQQFSRIVRRIALSLLIGAICLTLPVLAQDTGAQTYVVQPGDNLYRIAERFSTSVSALAEANNITLTWQIFVGQSLIIPGLVSAAPAPQPTADPTNLDFTE